MTSFGRLSSHTASILAPNAAFRFSPLDTEPQQKTSLLRSVLPGMPRFRPASEKEATGPERKVWLLQDGTPVAVPVVAGVSDGRHTQIVGGEIKPDQAVIVDTGCCHVNQHRAH